MSTDPRGQGRGQPPRDGSGPQPRAGSSGAPSRPTGGLRVVLLAVVAGLGLVLAWREDDGVAVYLGVGLLAALLAAVLAVARYRQRR
ncbi:MAG TPA: hypothetical protein VK063_02745 [Beutenbergiaceae bacterium]|nr:hypothetical protein [Beutenbergiaceae bacterium]